ncbi:GC-rich sequence DNA-binding factor protein [Aureococcus anophagefferens]|uniref:GC-rich sequence DNA-binding factor protein n=1 Tax=Aureococcus anophagefferens TaxID=44056 RepID=A0ABR1FJE6_AURAN
MSSSDEDEARPRLGLGAAKKRKADAYLGVFGDDDDEAPRRGLGGKRPAKGGNDSKPMAFVSAAAPAPPPPPPRRAARRARRRTRTFAFLAEPAAPAPAPPRPAFGGRKAAQPEWMKHTKGVGFKMLEKMGFTGRLGKEEQGVSRHVEVTKRPEGMGLGFAAARGFVEEAKLGANVQLQRELATPADRLADFDAALAAVEAAAGSGDVAAFKAALERARALPEEWALCGVRAAAARDAAAPLARAAFAGWRPLEDPAAPPRSSRRCGPRRSSTPPTT